MGCPELRVLNGLVKSELAGVELVGVELVGDNVGGWRRSLLWLRWWLGLGEFVGLVKADGLLGGEVGVGYGAVTG